MGLVIAIVSAQVTLSINFFKSTFTISSDLFIKRMYHLTYNMNIAYIPLPSGKASNQCVISLDLLHVTLTYGQLGHW